MRLRVGQRKGLGMISCVERASLHFCSDAAAARVANARMQPSGASHRLCEAYCQRLAGRSFLDAHAAFHDVFFRSEPSARCGRSGRVVGASRRPVRSWDAPRRLSCPAEACSRWPTRPCVPEFQLALCTPARPRLSWVVSVDSPLGASGSGRQTCLVLAHLLASHVFFRSLTKTPMPMSWAWMVSAASKSPWLG